MRYNDYVTIDELSRIMQYDNEETSHVRDIVLFSCLTGLKFSEIGIIQVCDIQTNDRGERCIGLYNPLPHRFDSIVISRALVEIIERNIANKNDKDMIFTFPSESKFRRHLRIIIRDCKLRCKITSFTGQNTCEYHFDYMSQNDPDNLIKEHFARS